MTKKKIPIDTTDYGYNKWHINCVLDSDAYRGESITLFFSELERFKLPSKDLKELYNEVTATRRSFTAFINLLTKEVKKIDNFLECVKMEGVGMGPYDKEIETFKLKA